METQAPANSVENFAQRAANKAEQGIESTRQTANQALDKASELSQTVPSLLSQFSDQIQEAARRGIEQAKCLSRDTKDKVNAAGERAVTYVKDEPVKSILIAAATGAAAAALIGWLARSRNSDRG